MTEHACASESDITYMWDCDCEGETDVDCRGERDKEKERIEKGLRRDKRSKER